MDDAHTLVQIDVGMECFTLAPVRLAPVLKRALSVLTGQLPGSQVRAFTDAVRQVSVLADPALLTRAFSDLLLTAAHCVGEAESITLDTHFAAGRGSVAMVTEGRSLSVEAIETFFDVGGQRTLLKGGGDFGISAALASRIIRLFNGRVSVRNGLEQGIIIEVVLPADEGAP
jgi:K+-sensing histidine kinase KdpD